MKREDVNSILLWAVLTLVVINIAWTWIGHWQTYDEVKRIQRTISRISDVVEAQEQQP